MIHLPRPPLRMMADFTSYQGRRQLPHPPIEALVFPETKESVVNRPEKIATQTIRLTQHLPTFWRVTFDIPPVNIFGPKQLPELNEIITAIENDEELKVVVFDSAVDGFFITHYDFVTPLEESAKIPPGPTGLQALPDKIGRAHV